MTVPQIISARTARWSDPSALVRLPIASKARRKQVQCVLVAGALGLLVGHTSGRYSGAVR